MLLALGGCADQGKQREAELTDLLSWLQGSYDNRAQADADAQKAGHAPRERIALLVMPVYVPRVGKHVLYAQESAADDPRRVMSERLFSFDIDEKRGIVGLVFDFVEPRRWRDGQNNPEIFTSVVTQDVSPRAASCCGTAPGSSSSPTSIRSAAGCPRAAPAATPPSSAPTTSTSPASSSAAAAEAHR